MSGKPASIDSLGDRVGEVAARHLVGAFRAFVPGSRGPRVTHAPGYLRVVTGEAHPFGNLVVASDPDDLGAMEEAAALLARLTVPSLVLLPYPEASRPMRELLADMGFELHPSMPAMAVDVDRLAATSLPAGYELSRVESEDQADAWVEALAVGYELPLPVAELFSPRLVLGDPSLAFYSVTRSGRIVGTSALHLADGVAGVYCVATVPEERGRGLGAHATAEPLRLARREGWRVGVLQSSPSGHGVYLRLGFEDAAEVLLFLRMPPETA